MTILEIRSWLSSTDIDTLRRRAAISVKVGGFWSRRRYYAAAFPPLIPVVLLVLVHGPAFLTVALFMTVPAVALEVALVGARNRLAAQEAVFWLGQIDRLAMAPGTPEYRLTRHEGDQWVTLNNALMEALHVREEAVVPVLARARAGVGALIWTRPSLFSLYGSKLAPAAVWMTLSSLVAAGVWLAER